MDASLVRLALLLGVLAVGAVVGLLLRRREGRVRAVAAGRAPGRLSAADLGAPLGARATLLQVSAPVCAPCRAARRVLGAVAEHTAGVGHVELDADEHLPLVRRLGVFTTPSLLVLDADGQVVARSSGVPTPAQVGAALVLAGVTDATDREGAR
jgi:thiol-disulfide isomerase/thioredoxin